MQFRLSKMFFLLAAACLVWSVILSVGAVIFFGVSSSMAWIVGGGVVAALGGGIALASYEISRAIEIPEEREFQEQFLSPCRAVGRNRTLTAFQGPRSRVRTRRGTGSHRPRSLSVR
jgi:hypothetical protein